MDDAQDPKAPAIAERIGDEVETSALINPDGQNASAVHVRSDLMPGAPTDPSGNDLSIVRSVRRPRHASAPKMKAKTTYVDDQPVDWSRKANHGSMRIG